MSRDFRKIGALEGTIGKLTTCQVTIMGGSQTEQITLNYATFKILLELAEEAIQRKSKKLQSSTPPSRVVLMNDESTQHSTDDLPPPYEDVEKTNET